MIEQHQHLAQKAADIATIASGSIAVTSSITQVNEYLQAAAYVVAIVSGLAAAWYHLRNRKK
jgi:hypothetical protein